MQLAGHEVQLLRREPSEILRVWDKVQTVPHMKLNVFDNDKVELTYQKLLDPSNLFFLIDDCGLVGALPVHHSAHVHITFWDRRLRGRELVCKELALAIQRSLRYNYLWTIIPDSARIVLAFARRVGFVTAMQYNNASVLVFLGG
jgi:hypothetical protein